MKPPHSGVILGGTIALLMQVEPILGQIEKPLAEFERRFDTVEETDGGKFICGSEELNALVSFDERGNAELVLYDQPDGNMSLEVAEQLVTENLGSLRETHRMGGNIRYTKLPDREIFASFSESDRTLFITTAQFQSEPSSKPVDQEILRKAEAGDLPAMREMARHHQGTRQAVMWELELAKRGEADYQAKIALRYHEGNDVPKDAAVAADWFSKAATQGNIPAKIMLADYYFSGTGVQKDAKKAVSLMSEAAEEGNEIAQYKLGRIYCSQKNYVEGHHWLLKSASQGYAPAQGILGGLYFEGKGTPKNFALSYKWLLLASSQGMEAASEMLPLVEQRLTASQLAEGQREAAEFDAEKSEKVEQSDIKTGASGTGFFISSEGHILTNHHVVGGGRKFSVTHKGGTSEARLVKSDEATDLAVLKIEEASTSALSIVPSKEVKMGAEVMTVGFPNPALQGKKPKLASGEIASLSGGQDDPRLFQISVPLQAGNSGGPLADSSGNVVGVVSFKLNPITSLVTTGSMPENVNYAVKSSYALSFLESLPEIYALLPTASEETLKRDKLVQKVANAAVLIEVSP